MWYRNDNILIKFDDIQLESEILLSGKRIFFLDGPTRCGKTYFLKHMCSSNVIVSPFCVVVETLYEFLERKETFENYYDEIDRKYPCCILALEDIDISLVGKAATQTEMAALFDRMIEGRKIILTGIDIDRRCAELLASLGSDKYDYFRFIK